MCIRDRCNTSSVWCHVLFMDRRKNKTKREMCIRDRHKVAAINVTVSTMYNTLYIHVSFPRIYLQQYGRIVPVIDVMTFCIIHKISTAQKYWFFSNAENVFPTGIFSFFTTLILTFSSQFLKHVISIRSAKTAQIAIVFTHACLLYTSKSYYL